MIEQAIGDLGKCISLYVNHDTIEVSCHNERWSRSRRGLDSSGRNYWKTILNVVDVKIAENRNKLVQRHKRTYNHLIKCLSGGCMPPPQDWFSFGVHLVWNLPSLNPGSIQETTSICCHVPSNHRSHRSFPYFLKVSYFPFGQAKFLTSDAMSKLCGRDWCGMLCFNYIFWNWIMWFQSIVIVACDTL